MSVDFIFEELKKNDAIGNILLRDKPVSFTVNKKKYEIKNIVSQRTIDKRCRVFFLLKPPKPAVDIYGQPLHWQAFFIFLQDEIRKEGGKYSLIFLFFDESA